MTYNDQTYHIISSKNISYFGPPWLLQEDSITYNDQSYHIISSKNIGYFGPPWLLQEDEPLQQV